jgi:nucleoid-associated protein YgaU
MKTDGTAPVPAVIRSLAVALALAMPAMALADRTGMTQSSTKPPRTGKFVGDHWTPWNPPTPAEGARVYTIQKGDTLWDLAQKDLGDPYLWPRIWDQNRYVLDSHWI